MGRFSALPRTALEPLPVEGARWIPLTRGMHALVDDEVFERLSLRNWCVSTKGYAVSGEPLELMHRVVMGVTDPNVEVDHVFGNKLDNRKGQLRVATRSQNKLNRPAPSNNTSGHKGVWLHKANMRWRAEISCRGKTYRLGYFDTPEEAAAAYAAKATELAGEFASAHQYGDLSGISKPENT